MIRPGLERIHRLLHGIDLSWKVIHVAGTNGKGSVCAYLSAMLHDCNISTGRFTSPHLIDRWDCITIDERPVSENVFLEVEEQVKWRNNTQSIDATPFELLTATAFQIFNRERVRIGVVECGMGGRLDATNVFNKPLVTVITRLGMDHMAFLGSTESQIAFEKAGIMKPGAPCVVDSSSSDRFLKKIIEQAEEKDVRLYYTPLPRGHSRKIIPISALASEYYEMGDSLPRKPLFPQVNNMWCAYRALALAMPQLKKPFKDLALVMDRAVMPGRYQRVDISSLVDRKEPAILDGAHNFQSFQTLIPWCKSLASKQGRSLVWVVAFSKGRDPKPFFDSMTPADKVIIVEFGPVDGMPWVEPLPSPDYEHIIKDNANWTYMGHDITAALKQAAMLAGEGPLVITGSLYLVSDVLRLLRVANKGAQEAGTTTAKPAVRYVFKDAKPERQPPKPISSTVSIARFMYEQGENLHVERDEVFEPYADDSSPQPGDAAQVQRPPNAIWKIVPNDESSVVRKFVANDEPNAVRDYLAKQESLKSAVTSDDKDAATPKRTAHNGLRTRTRHPPLRPRFYRTHGLGPQPSESTDVIKAPAATIRQESEVPSASITSPPISNAQDGVNLVPPSRQADIESLRNSVRSPAPDP